MILYGTHATTLLQKILHFVCSSCGQTEHTAYIFQRYFHIFFVPSFPLTKSAATECTHCRKVSKQEDLRLEPQTEVRHLLGGTSTPKWMFTGIVVVTILLSIGFYLNSEEIELTKAYHSMPVPGDLALLDQLNHDGKSKTVVKVVEVNGESVTLMVSNYIYSKATGAIRDAQKKIAIDEADFFAKDTHKISLDLYRELPILEIVRK